MNRLLVAVVVCLLGLTSCSEPPEVEGCLDGRALIEVEDREDEPDIVAFDPARDEECD
jgi:hypothetical protein